MDLMCILEERGFVQDQTRGMKEFLSGKARKIYVGFDPTAGSLHLGNFMGMMLLAWAQKCGHTPVILLGGATALVGDPSGKSMERPQLSVNEVEENVQKIKKQFFSVLDFSGTYPEPLIVNNFSWFKELDVISFLRDTGTFFRVGPMLGKESVRARIQSSEGISFTEFSYQLLQGYDFWHLYRQHEVSVQFGGSDQWGNITAGIDLVRKKLGREQVHGGTWPLLLRSDGKKFGKSESGTLWLDPTMCSPYEMFQYLLSIPDMDVEKMLCMLTFFEKKEISEWKEMVKRESAKENFMQMRLAEGVTKILHGEEGLAHALQVTQATHSSGGVGDYTEETIQILLQEVPSFCFDKMDLLQKKIVDVLASTGFVSSKSEIGRLIRNKGLYLNGLSLTDSLYVIQKSDFLLGKYLIFSIGKKRKMIIQI